MYSRTPEEETKLANDIMCGKASIGKILSEKEYCGYMARGLTHLIWREGVVEDLHSGVPAVLDDTAMKMLNKDINNRIYTILLRLRKEPDLMDTICLYGMQAGQDWDAPDLVNPL